MIVEEPDFSSGIDLTGTEKDSHNKLNKAIGKMFENMGLYPDYGLRLPGELTNTGFSIENIEAKIHLCNETVLSLK